MQGNAPLLANSGQLIVTPPAERRVIAIDKHGLYLLLFDQLPYDQLRQRMIKRQFTACRLQLLLKILNGLQHKLQARFTLVRMRFNLPGIENKAGNHLP